MKAPPAPSLLVACMSLFISCAAANAQAPTECPVTLEHLDLRYNHAAGRSLPQVDVQFTNATSKRILRITLSLAILDSGGYAHPYDRNFVYGRGLDAGRRVKYLWALDPGQVDIHHAGETVTLAKVEFADGTAWHDEGSLKCTLNVDFHAN